MEYKDFVEQVKDQIQEFFTGKNLQMQRFLFIR